MDDARLNVHATEIDPNTPSPEKASLARDAAGRVSTRGTQFPRKSLVDDPDAPLHVTPAEDGWSLAFEGSDEFVALLPTKKEAMAKARELANKHGLRVVEHGQDGRMM